MEIAAKYKEIEEFRSGDVGSFLRWQYGIYRSMGMTYEEFWEKDHLLVESFIKRNEMEIERETSFNWENVTYTRMALHEIVELAFSNSKQNEKKFKFPDTPHARNTLAQLHKERNKNIAQEIRAVVQSKIDKRKGESDVNN